MAKEQYLTEEGLKQKEEELEHLKTVARKEVAEKIKIALGYGDLSENAEYDQAKNDQAALEEKIAKLENILRNAVLIDEAGDTDNKSVKVGSNVRFKDMDTDEFLEYQIVGVVEADPFNGKISNESPVGRAMIGRKRNQVVEVEAPSGIKKYKITKIS